MTMQDDPPVQGGRWDGLAARLQLLRVADGEPSYAEIARRVTLLRAARGLSSDAARVARSTVFDCFRPGRARVSLPLVRDIALVLGVDPADVDGWIAEAQGAQQVHDATPEAGQEPEAVPEASSEPLPAETAGSAAATVATVATGPTTGSVLLLMLACVAVNLLGRVVVDVLQLPLYLDMIGTALAALALGPWRGAAVGLATNLVGVVPSGWDSVPFALVNVAGALVWGYGVRRGLGRTLPRFLALNVAVALACTLVAVPILVLVFGGSVGHGEDAIVDTLRDLGSALVVAIGFSNLIASLADKTISGFLALVGISALPGRMRREPLLPFLAPLPPASADGRPPRTA
ncbi:ECF transporter S component [Nocardioides sp. TRM66260-LWL]|uniref:ECF transporter S component n=1 Tax=Nocardioides sp. TRM66260-LWL TaxID=2874478 RepID=UPI001CC33C1E|nr:ECF transporter S component [Nocardioides sp. TRM66260-LWL]MBZ5735946.1 ECF transporter S component [Nocardioides sp. TRM66260-LWL]